MGTRHLIWTKRLRVWFDPQGKSGALPTLVASRSGKNGSPAGFGPKPFPTWIPSHSYSTHDRWSGGGCIIHWDLPVGRYSTRRGKMLRWVYRTMAK